MRVDVFLFCYNEKIMLPYTVEHYRRMFPKCQITIMDNRSDDGSVELAESLGCMVVGFESGGQLDERVMTHMKNHCADHVGDGWVIVADMDEWICATHKDLEDEERNGTSVLRTQGYDMTADSKTSDLSDIRLHDVMEGCWWGVEGDKNIAFRRPMIECMNYGIAAHSCCPSGHLVWSKNLYLLKHMSFLGEEFLVEKYKARFDRSGFMRANGLSGHYSDDREKVSALWNTKWSNRSAIPMGGLHDGFMTWRQPA